jgi:hypothetical protein
MKSASLYSAVNPVSTLSAKLSLQTFTASSQAILCIAQPLCQPSFFPTCPWKFSLLANLAILSTNGVLCQEFIVYLRKQISHYHHIGMAGSSLSGPGSCPDLSGPKSERIRHEPADLKVCSCGVRAFSCFVDGHMSGRHGEEQAGEPPSANQRLRGT